MSLLDWITDFQGETVGYQLNEISGQVHEGILKAASAILDESLPVLEKALAKNPGYKIVATGHSLGGGVSGMLGLLLHTHPITAQSGYESYPLAPPMVFSTTFNVYLCPNITTMVFGNDIVPRLCFGTVKDILNTFPFWEKLDKEGSSLSAKKLKAALLEHSQTLNN
jgi:hypothetical protein